MFCKKSIIYTLKQKKDFHKKTVYSLITILASNIHLNAENIKIIDTPIIETKIINTIETTDDTLPVAEKSAWMGHIPFTVAINSKGEVQFAQSGVI